MCPPNAKECQSEETTHKTKTHSNATINKMGSSHSSNATAMVEDPMAAENLSNLMTSRYICQVVNYTKSFRV